MTFREEPKYFFCSERCCSSRLLSVEVGMSQNGPHQRLCYNSVKQTGSEALSGPPAKCVARLRDHLQTYLSLHLELRVVVTQMAIGFRKIVYNDHGRHPRLNNIERAQRSDWLDQEYVVATLFHKKVGCLLVRPQCPCGLSRSEKQIQGQPRSEHLA